MREVTVFLCYRRVDGRWAAEWLNERLLNVKCIDPDGSECRITPYFDETFPAVADWKAIHFPSLQTARALLVICTPGIATDLSRDGRPDFVYEELRWWVGTRKAAPIVVDTTGEGDRWLPDVIRDRWPNINRISLTRSEATGPSQPGVDYGTRVCNRIVGAILELEHQTLFEDLVRSQRQETRLRWALAVATALLLLAAGLGLYANERRKDALMQAQIAQERHALVAELLIKSFLDGGSGLTSSSLLLRLLSETSKRADETQFTLTTLTLKCGHDRTSESRLDEVAGLDRHELTGYSRSGLYVLEAQTKEASRGTSCDRFGWKGIANLRASQRRPNRRGAAVPNQCAGGLPEWSSAESGRDGDLQRSVRCGGRRAAGGA